MKKASVKNIAILCGGGSPEHSISIESARFIRTRLQTQCQFYTQIYELENRNSIRNLPIDDVDFVIPVVHGRPGETGEIAAFLDLHGIPYLGCHSESAQLTFNKISTKLWLDALGIPNTPYTFLTDLFQQKQAKEFFVNYHDIFIKAASQGSSVGCFHVTKIEDLEAKIIEAFKFSKYVLIEKTIKGRELEVAVYERHGKIIVTHPSEIILPENQFYSYDEKYSENSHSQTVLKADIPTNIIEKITDYALRAFKGLKLRHLSRIDFFLVDENTIYLNEINTMPGMTPISMFPKMMEANGDKFEEYLSDIILKALA